MTIVKASNAYRIYLYKNNKINPNINLITWDNFLITILRHNVVKFSVNNPYYNEINNFINRHYKYFQPYQLAYATEQHIGIFGIG